ncbi:Hypothetical protein, putative [Bodo saltans]|uniref:Uncharacterized protein n=1 Tax=Bodo saltans TaxID=75058 RepID=A0A0S4JEY4_BODSA|nr:Hypothetical protein, putative [Bodo saltans]|eukprot:CUG88605.1 Hypothetical protein, putative [Bodo saltans]
MPVWVAPKNLRHRTTLTDILTRSVDTLAREMEWEHNLVLSKQLSGRSDATSTSTTTRLSLSTLEFRHAARSVAWSVLVPPRVAPTKEALLHSLSTSTPVFDMSNASIAAVKATRESIAESILEAFSSGAEDVEEVGRKRPRCDAPRTSPLCRIERFARNAFRGPYLNQVVATLHEGGDRDDISETESVVLLPNPDRRTRRRGGDKTRMSDEEELTPTTLHAYYLNTFGLRKDRAQLQSAHVSQLLANGVAHWLKTNSRFELEALSAALYVPAVSLRLATSLELVNFITMSMLPTSSVGQLVHQAHAAFMEPRQRPKTEENWSLATEEAQPFRGGTTMAGTSSLASTSGSLSAIGSQSRSLESAQRHMSETILYGNKRAKPEPFSRGELLHQASQRCRIPLESIVSALAEFGSRGSDADLLPSHIGAPAMPSREEFDAMDADSKKQLYQSILRHQFRALGGCSPSTGIDLSYEAQRARHLAHVPLEALVVLVIATNTGDPYEQLMIRYYRIPFSPRTTKYELGQWLWNDEHVMLVGNLLSYVTESERFVAMRAAKVNVKILPLLLSMGSNEGDPTTGTSEDCSIGKNNRNLVDLILYLLRGRNQSGAV